MMQNLHCYSAPLLDGQVFFVRTEQIKALCNKRYIPGDLKSSRPHRIAYSGRVLVQKSRVAVATALVLPAFKQENQINLAQKH